MASITPGKRFFGRELRNLGGGAVSVERSWLNGRWYVNPAWADLKFTYDALDGSVKTIDRGGSVFEGSGDLFVFDDRFFLRRTSTEVNGATVIAWRWNNTAGDWVDFDASGKISAYGDQHEVSVQFVTQLAFLSRGRWVLTSCL